MAYVIGILLAFGVGFFALLTGLSRDRAFYPTVLIVIALYYVLFAVMGGSPEAILVESLVMAGFAAIAVTGFKGSPWLVAAGLAAHGVFDAFHGGLHLASSVPAWWPAFCLAFDVTAGTFLALLHKTRWMAQ